MKQLVSVIHLCIILTLCCSHLASAQTKEKDENGDNREKMRSRLEQLFIWRVSDRLQLTPDEESQFTTEYKKLSEERSKSSQKMDALLDDLSKATDKKTKAKILNDYEEAFKKYTQVQQTEMNTMKHLFDSDKLADYMLLKRDMLHKFKDVLSMKTTEVAKTPNKPRLKDPEVFQEK